MARSHHNPSSSLLKKLTSTPLGNYQPTHPSSKPSALRKKSSASTSTIPNPTNAKKGASHKPKAKAATDAELRKMVKDLKAAVKAGMEREEGMKAFEEFEKAWMGKEKGVEEGGVGVEAGVGLDADAEGHVVTVTEVAAAQEGEAKVLARPRTRSQTQLQEGVDGGIDFSDLY